jgi:hypothetical protein
MAENNLFIEKHNDGYHVQQGDVSKTVHVAPTQEKAIEWAQKNHSGAAIHVERVRDVETGGRDKWRKI